MRNLLGIIFFLLALNCFSQNMETTNFIKEIEKADISNLLTISKFQIENDTTWVQRPEPVGFIGENYQRIRMKFISVIQNNSNKLEYFVYGKTKVKNNVCDFQGLLRISETQLYKNSDISSIQQGYIKGEYEFFENPNQSGTGIFKGIFQTNFYLNENGKIIYDALMWVSDSFTNNEFIGNWTSYQTKDTKTCNWGDFRIPESGDFDCGAGEFSPSEKYAQFGWQTYILANTYWKESPEIESARKKELLKWWQ